MQTILVLLGLLALIACTTIDHVNLTECDHPSGWCKETRDAAVDSYVYAQLASNAYEDRRKFVLPPSIKLVRQVPNDQIGFA